MTQLPVTLVTKDASVDLCPRCKQNPAEQPHTCPYAEEIHNDSETLCTCCADCTYECVIET